MRRLLLALVLLTSACGSPFGKTCPDDIVSGLIVTVTNAATGADICDATVTAVNGGQTVTLFEIAQTAAGSCTYSDSGQLGGASTVTVQATGFRTATARANVSTDSCGTLETEHLGIALTAEQ